MKIAFLITAYHKTEQLTRLVDCLGKKIDYSDIYIHFDLKSKVDDAWLKTLSDFGVSVVRLHKIYWGGFSQLKSIVALIAIALKKSKYDYFILLSGQDLPIKSHLELQQFLEANQGRSFIESTKFPLENWSHCFGRVHWFWFLDYFRFRGVHRFHQFSHYLFERFSIVKPSAKNIDYYGGSDWWMLPHAVAEYCVHEFDNNKKLVSSFRHSFIPSEMFFQTVISNSNFKCTVVNSNKRYIVWREGSGHPENITSDDMSRMLNSDCYFARKFDMDADPLLFNKVLKIF